MTRSSGFTLLEMLVVLVIVSLTSAIVFPRLSTIGSSVEFALQRETVEQALNALSYQAFRNNDDMVLYGSYTNAGRIANSGRKPKPGEALPANLRTLSLGPTQRDQLPPINSTYAALSLPEGWQLVASDPIYFRSSGYCDGGKVDLIVGQREYRYTLSPPLCHAVLVE
jgi:prepilin-type N-terminal cleavage/methylation domain-containing protein